MDPDMIQVDISVEAREIADDRLPGNRVGSASSALDLIMQEVHHDPEYYFPDGSTVILVEPVLFKVHWTILSKDSSVFEAMFMLPPVKGDIPEGRSDENPVVLQGDTPMQFRSLLWALYAMPHKLPQAGTIQGEGFEFDRFCDLTRMAHKYGFKGLETWALKTFVPWLSPSAKHPPPFAYDSAATLLLRTYPNKISLDRLCRVLELASLCDDPTLRMAAVQRLQDELQRSGADLVSLVAIGERFDIATLVGPAYYALMLKGRKKWLYLATAGHLNQTQLAKLHNGHYSLVSLWETLRVTAPQIKPCTHSSNGKSCQERWDAYWKEMTKREHLLGMFPADVLGKLERLQVCSIGGPRISDMNSECRIRVCAIMRVLIREIREGLAAHFVNLP